MLKFAILALALGASTAAVAETSTPGLDPNDVICRTVSATGSRLARSRRCATRAQWAEDEREQRAVHSERTLRQVNPQNMSAAERAFANGRSVNVGGAAVPQ